MDSSLSVIVTKPHLDRAHGDENVPLLPTHSDEMVIGEMMSVQYGSRRFSRAKMPMISPHRNLASVTLGALSHPNSA
jgi:hypothetical protein